jgi:hypothetical protein
MYPRRKISFMQDIADGLYVPRLIPILADSASKACSQGLEAEQVVSSNPFPLSCSALAGFDSV